MAEWQSVETAPTMTRVLLCYGGDKIAIAEYTRVGAATGWYMGADGAALVFAHKATHWMPLPAPPNSGGTEHG